MEEKEHLIFTQNDNHFSDLIWCTLAIDKKDYRTFKSTLRIDSSTLIGTNGRTMHIVYDVDMPDGTYTIKEQTKSVIVLKRVGWITYPNWRRAMPDIRHSESYTLSIGPDKRSEIGMTIGKAYGYIVSVTNTWLNVDFLKPLCNRRWSMLHDPLSGNLPLTFVCAPRTAVIAPITKSHGI